MSYSIYNPYSAEDLYEDDDIEDVEPIQPPPKTRRFQQDTGDPRNLLAWMIPPHALNPASVSLEHILQNDRNFTDPDNNSTIASSNFDGYGNDHLEGYNKFNLTPAEYPFIIPPTDAFDIIYFKDDAKVDSAARV
jgi:hypothetical protein